MKQLKDLQVGATFARVRKDGTEFSALWVKEFDNEDDTTTCGKMEDISASHCFRSTMYVIEY